ncbi:hypothetical protein KSP39_PZI017861 [Platanthera zijinensis]|uniref:Uncharacterized protein n=1 Tax=Platanthera zijinensis TaxID=2320716 RepID=A0AAP0B654_9ASPA
MGDFTRLSNNEITILGNDAEISTGVDPQEAKQTLEIAEANLSRAVEKEQESSCGRSRRISRVTNLSPGASELSRAITLYSSADWSKR